VEAAAELLTTPDVVVGESSSGIFALSCLQLYDKTLTPQQLDQAAQLCKYKGSS